MHQERRAQAARPAGRPAGVAHALAVDEVPRVQHAARPLHAVEIAAAREDWSALLRGETIERPIVENVALRDLKDQPDLLWSVLVFSGYLKVVSQRLNERTNLGTLAIPNEEVKSIFETQFEDWLSQGLGGDSQRRDFLVALLAGDADDDVQKDVQCGKALHVQFFEVAGEYDLVIRKLGLDALCDRVGRETVLDLDEQCRHLALGPELLLHRTERYLDAAAGTRLVRSDECEITVVNAHLAADDEIFLLYPGDICDHLVGTVGGLSPLGDLDAGNRRVLVKIDAVNQPAAGIGVRDRNAVLCDRHRGRDTVDLLNVLGQADRQTQGLGTAEAEAARGTQHYLGADIRLTLCPLAQTAVGQTDREYDQQDADTDAYNADRRPGRPVQHI